MNMYSNYRFLCIEILNNGRTALSRKSASWEIIDKSNSNFAEGKFVVPTVQIGKRVEVGNITENLSKISAAGSYTAIVEIDGTNYKNEWQIWVYPAKLEIKAGDIVITANRSEAFKALYEGKKVLFSPKISEIKGLEGKFVQVFWSPVHFPNQAGSMGLL